jgi:hypothetical protein
VNWIKAKLTWAWRWLIGRQPYTLTLNACAQTAHLFAGAFIIMTAAHFRWPTVVGWAVLAAWVCYKEFYNDIHNEGASYEDGAVDGSWYAVGGFVAQCIIWIH